MFTMEMSGDAWYCVIVRRFDCTMYVCTCMSQVYDVFVGWTSDDRTHQSPDVVSPLSSVLGVVWLFSPPTPSYIGLPFSHSWRTVSMVGAVMVESG